MIITLNLPIANSFETRLGQVNWAYPKLCGYIISVTQRRVKKKNLFKLKRKFFFSPHRKFKLILRKIYKAHINISSNETNNILVVFILKHVNMQKVLHLPLKIALQLYRQSSMDDE